MVGWSSTLVSASGMTFGGDKVKPTQGCKWGQEERDTAELRERLELFYPVVYQMWPLESGIVNCCPFSLTYS